MGSKNKGGKVITCKAICFDDPDGENRCTVCDIRTDRRRCYCCLKSTIHHSVDTSGAVSGINRTIENLQHDKRALKKRKRGRRR